MQKEYQWRALTQMVSLDDSQLTEIQSTQNSRFQGWTAGEPLRTTSRAEHALDISSRSGPDRRRESAFLILRSSSEQFSASSWGAPGGGAANRAAVL
jgi:hypothetical protein